MTRGGLACSIGPGIYITGAPLVTSLSQIFNKFVSWYNIIIIMYCIVYVLYMILKYKKKALVSYKIYLSISMKGRVDLR